MCIRDSPYIIPGSVLGITLLLAFNGKGDPLVLSGTATIMIISLVIRRLAYTLRSSSAILYQISPSVEEAAISLGDSPLKAFVKVTAKLMLPGVISGAILSWITLINELSSSVMLYTANTRTMSVAIYNEDGDAWLIQAESNGKIHLMDATNGSILDTLTLTSGEGEESTLAIEGSPAVYGNLMIIGTTGKDAGGVYCIKIE